VALLAVLLAGCTTPLSTPLETGPGVTPPGDSPSVAPVGPSNVPPQQAAEPARGSEEWNGTLYAYLPTQQGATTDPHALTVPVMARLHLAIVPEGTGLAHGQVVVRLREGWGGPTVFEAGGAPPLEGNLTVPAGDFLVEVQGGAGAVAAAWRFVGRATWVEDVPPA
jgi:hypothetical protein